MTQLYLVSGAGGVGKTTSSSALALSFASRGKRTLLVTVDPARRLADVLEQELGDLRKQYDDVPLLTVWMPSASTQLSSLASETMEAQTNERFEANRVTKLFHAAPAGLHEAVCALSLGQVAGDYDVVVVDTAPYEQALSFLKAPSRLRGLLEGGALKLFSSFGSSRGLGQRMVERMLRRVIPPEVVAEGAEFFRAILSVRAELEEHAQRAEGLLGEARHVVVAVPGESGADAALRLRRGLTFQGKTPLVILNRAEDGGETTSQAMRRLPGAHAFPSFAGSSKEIVQQLSVRLSGAVDELLAA